MKYIMTVLFATSLSLGAFAVGQNNTGPHQDCCNTGRCGNGMPMCNSARNSQRRELSSAKKGTMRTGKKSTTVKGE